MAATLRTSANAKKVYPGSSPGLRSAQYALQPSTARRASRSRDRTRSHSAITHTARS